MDGKVSHRPHDLILFLDDQFKNDYIDYFHWIVTSCGKPKTQVACNIVRTMITLFINAFLTMTCLSGYNETNINRLLINYLPDASAFVETKMLYPVVKQFKNLYWANSHLISWNLFPRFIAILRNNTPNDTISTADIILSVMFMQATGIIQINPILHMDTLNGNPLFIKDLICRYWFIKGLEFRDHYHFKYHNTDFFEKRKNNYINDCCRLKKLL